MNGARIRRAKARITRMMPRPPLSAESRRSPRPPNHMKRNPRSESNAIAPTAVTATVVTRMS